MKTFSTLITLMLHVFREQWKNRFFQLILIFTGMMLYAALLLGAMADEQESKILIDFGLGFIELAGLAAIIFGCAATTLKDMESKTIYLVLSRPVPKYVYILGKLFGLFLTVGAAIICMGFLHTIVLCSRGFSMPQFYFKILFLSWLKIVLIGSFAMAVSLFSTSILSTVVISSISWTLGHFLAEARFVLEKTQSAATLIITPLLYVVPNLQLYNLKDRWELASQSGPGWPVLIAYTLLYGTACALLSILLFRKKEF